MPPPTQTPESGSAASDCNPGPIPYWLVIELEALQREFPIPLIDLSGRTRRRSGCGDSAATRAKLMSSGLAGRQIFPANLIDVTGTGGESGFPQPIVAAISRIAAPATAACLPASSGSEVAAI